MFSTLLDTTGNSSMNSMILNIVIILGVVIASSLIVYFLCEVIAFIVKKNKDSENNILKLDDSKADAKDNVYAKGERFLISEYKLDDVEEKNNEQEDVVLIDENKFEEVDEEKAEVEKNEVESPSEEERQNEERRAYLEARRQELIRRMQEKTETTEEQTEEVEEKADEEELVEEKTEEEKTENSENVETINLEEEREALNAEKEKYELMVKELEEAKKALAEQTQIVQVPVVEKVVETVVEPGTQFTLDELKEKLAVAEERLKATEKEFKQCKKEYIPLRKVWNTHEKDEKKLRRKEALVAKQKVLLYGVNNYADIDKEKAQKLSEELDHLDGLKLSVQHCEEVMKKNKERYPLLEKMYEVLNLRNEELRSDIEKYKQEIAKLEEEQNITSETEEN